MCTPDPAPRCFWQLYSQLPSLETTCSSVGEGVSVLLGTVQAEEGHAALETSKLSGTKRHSWTFNVHYYVEEASLKRLRTE